MFGLLLQGFDQRTARMLVGKYRNCTLTPFSESAIEARAGNIIQTAGPLELAASTVYRKLQQWKQQPA